ncbi:MAG: DUF819 family protein [Pseudomonadales bacterium]|nr:DUF819 family protein [Pseudomonadales bacterium]
MPVISADNLTALAAVLFALAWLGFWIDRQPIASKIPGVPWVIGTGLILSNSGVIPMESAAYGFVGQFMLPLGVALLLYKANLRSIFKQGGWVLPAFLVASIGLSLGAIAGFYIFDLGDAGAKIAGTYTGAFIGGVVNFVAVSQAVGMTPTEFSVSLSASAPASIIGLLVLVALPSIAFIRRHFPSPIIDAAEQPTDAVAAEVHPNFRLDHIAGALAIGLAINAAALLISSRLGIETYNLFVVTVITVALANLMPRFFGALEGDFALGMLCMYAFFAMIGAGTDAIGFIKSAPILFVYCTFLLGIQFLVVLIATKIFKWDLAEALIGSAAAIVGPAVAAGVATAKGWRALITPAIAVGMLGYVIANFVGVVVFRLLK